MEAILEATIRDTRGKNEARRTRREGQVPGVLYGSSGGAANQAARTEAKAIAVQPKALLKILHSQSVAPGLPEVGGEPAPAHHHDPVPQLDGLGQRVGDQ